MTEALTLDARQRAMLDEMGVKLFWWRQPEPVEAPAPQAPVVQAESALEAEASAPPAAAPPRAPSGPASRPAPRPSTPRRPPEAQRQDDSLFF